MQRDNRPGRFFYAWLSAKESDNYRPKRTHKAIQVPHLPIFLRRGDWKNIRVEIVRPGKTSQSQAESAFHAPPKHPIRIASH